MHRPTTYDIDSDVETEVQYLSRTIRYYDQLAAYKNCRLPPVLETEVKAGARAIGAGRLREAIMADTVVCTPIEKLRDEWLAQHPSLFAAFFARMIRRPPFSIAVHVTKYGPGGSYHPDGLGKRSAGWAISIKDPAIARSSWSFNQTIVHETIELLIANEVHRRRTPKAIKEAIVDQHCSCNELQAVYGKYPRQSTQVAGPLPEDWQSYILWQAGKVPTWCQ